MLLQLGVNDKSSAISREPLDPKSVFGQVRGRHDDAGIKVQKSLKSSILKSARRSAPPLFKNLQHRAALPKSIFSLC